MCLQVWKLVTATMASANVTLENQLQSAQKNLLFLQQDHANTLKGLHAEIRRLQQQCTGERTLSSELLSSASTAFHPGHKTWFPDVTLNTELASILLNKSSSRWEARPGFSKHGSALL